MRTSRSLPPAPPRAVCETLEDRRLLSFSPAVNYATIGTPSAIVTADFNNDGKLDLVTCADAATGSYSVFLGDGAGGFGAAQRTVMSTQLSSLAAADFNNDGKVDLVVSDNYDYGFNFLAGKGDGTFQPPGFTQSGAVAAVGRFNGDNHTDVLVARLGPDWETQLLVYCGNGQGGFTPAEPDVWYYGTARAVVDLNNDGKLDVVTAEGYVFPGNGDGTFQFDWQQPALLNGGVVATGDFTGDGRPDAIVAGDNKVSVLRGRGDGTFEAPISQPLAGNLHTGVATADFNGDGKLDAVVSTYDTGAVRLMLGNGDGTLRDAGTFATGTEPSGVVVGDFNRDGRPDVAVSNAVSRTVSVLLNDGVWGVTPVHPTVTDVFLAGTAWTSAFRNSLPTRGEGEAAFGHRFGPTPQTQTIGYSNLNQISLRFDKAAAGVESGDLVVGGVNVTSYGVASFAYDAATFTATWTLNRAIPNDNVTFAVDLDATPGADFTSSVRVLPGDVDRNGAVNVFDFNALKQNLNQSNRGVLGGDINGDGVVNVFDFNELKLYLGLTTPP